MIVIHILSLYFADHSDGIQCCKEIESRGKEVQLRPYFFNTWFTDFFSK